MTKYKTQLIFLIVLLTNSNVWFVSAQEIKGDTIFVNAEAEVLVIFPSLPTFFNTNPSKAPYNFKTAGTGFTVSAKAENTKPVPLTVSEGGRNHHFILAFKKNINYDDVKELEYDYSSVKKLEQHIKETTSGASTADTRPAEPKIDAKKNKKVPDADENKTLKYYALLEEGEKNFKQQLYKEAKSNFEEAHDLRPNDLLPLQRLEDIKVAMADKEKSDEQEKNKKYISLTATARANLDLKKYAEANEGYKQALELRPGDLYATHQIEKITNILNAENSKKEQKELKDLYNSYMAAGERALSLNLLADAKIAYEQALAVVKNDPVASARLTVISGKEKLQKQNQDLESNYNAAIQSADKLFKAGDYNNAKIEYNKALGFIKRTWPQEQIKDINKIIADQAAKETSDRQKLLQQAETEKKEKESQALELKYYDLIRSADSLYQAGDYANAKKEYARANDLIKRPWPEAQMIKISQLLKDQALKANTEKQKQAQQEENEKKQRENRELQNKYDSAVQLADKFFNDKDYDDARVVYNKAIGFKTTGYVNTTRAEEQLKKINTIMAEDTAQKNAEKLKQAEEAAITSKYLSAIEKADIEFDKNNYIKAKKLYIDAAVIKPSEEHPREKLLAIQNVLDKVALEEKAKTDSIAVAAEIKRKYDLALSKSKSYFLKGDLLNAKISYQEAADLRPTEREPQTQLKIINDKLDEIAKGNEADNKYEQKIAVADSQLISKAYEPALTAYKEALVLKPAESYPKSQIKYIETEVKNIQKEKEENEKREAKRKEEELEKEYQNSIVIADKAVKNKRYEEAKSAYSEALKIDPDNEYAIQRFKIATYQSEKEKTVSDSNSTAKGNDQTIAEKKSDPQSKNKVITKNPAIQTNGGGVYQANPIPYTAEELKSKYPAINFSVIPPEQPFNETFVKSVDNQYIFKEILLQKPRLALASTDHEVNLILQGITFEESLVYIKLLIRNNADEDFLTGPMMLTWTRKNGNNIKLYPLYLFPAYLPIVKPGYESIVIYVCKSYNIIDQEKLKFELADRFSKIKLQISIPGSIYTDEMARLEYR